MAIVVGTVRLLTGKAIAMSPDGTERVLALGDPIFEDDVIRTAPDATIEIAMENGEVVALDSGENWMVSIDAFETEAEFQVDDAVASADAIQAAILAGEDPTAVAEATAAGAPAAGATGDGGGTQVEIIDRTADEVTPEAGYDTTGFDESFPPPDEEEVFPDLLPTVAVSVGIDVGTPTDPNDPEPPTSGNPTVAGNTIYVLEGSGLPDEGQDPVTTEVHFNLILSEVFDQDVTVTYALVDDTAEYGVDWLDGDSPDQVYTVVIPAGETEIPVFVKTIHDKLDEDNESLDIVLISAENATIDPTASTGSVVIWDDDTTPEAVADTNWIVTEPNLPDSSPSVLTAEGNVIQDIDHPVEDPATGEFADNADTDEDGDAVSVLSVSSSKEGVDDISPDADGEVIEGMFGTLEISDTGEYTYTYTGDPLEAGTTEQDVFTYIATDGFGNDAEPTTLTITIFAGDNGVEITNLTPQAEGGDVLVDEDDLVPDGSDQTQSTTQGGSFNINAPDGVDTLTIDGNAVITAGVFAATSFTTSVLGNTLSITGYNVETGEVTYTYTLDDNEDHSPGDDLENSIFENLTVFVSDVDGDEDTGTLSVQVVDDVVAATLDSGDVNEGAVLDVDADNGVLSNDTAGADGMSIQGVVAGSDTSSPIDNANVGSQIAGSYGFLTLYADGSYSYESTDDGITEDVQDVFVYTIVDGDGDTSTTTLTINLTDSGLTAGDDDVVTVNEAALDLNQDGDDLAAGSVTGSLPGSTAETDGDTLTDNVSGGFGTLTYSLVGSSSGSYGEIFIDSDGSYTYTLTDPIDGADADNGTNTEDNAESFTYMVEDANGNTSTGTIYIDIVDDIPSVSAGNPVGDTITLTTDDTEAEGGNDGGFTNTASDSGQLAAALLAAASATVDYGADGMGDDDSIGSFVLSAEAVTSSLTSGGDAINLYEVDGTVVGSTAGDVDSIDGDNTIFTVSVDGDGVVTLTQSGPIDHDENADPTVHDELIALGDGEITLSATVTVMDGDGDTDTTPVSVDLGGNIRFEDDGPSIDASSIVAADTLSVDESDLSIDDTTNFANNFAAAISYGADGAGSTVYTLELGDTSVGSGLFAIDNTDTDADDGDGFGQGDEILMTQTGNIITGSVGGVDYFTITIDTNTGDVTFNQLAAIWHDTTSDHNELMTLTTDAAEDLLIRATVTDSDGDVVSDTIDLGANVFSIADDGPKAFIPERAHVVLDTGDTFTPVDITQSLNFEPGEDGLGGVVFNLTLDDNDGGPDPVRQVFRDSDGNQLYLDNEPLYLYYTDDTHTVIEARTDDGDVAFTATTDSNEDGIADGDVTVTMFTGKFITNTQITEVTDLSGIGGGNVPFKGLNIGTNQVPDPDGSDDVLVSSEIRPTEDGDEGTVNSNATELGVGQGNEVSAGEIVRFDLVTGLTIEDQQNNESYAFDDYQETFVFKQQVNVTGGSKDADFILRIYRETDTNVSGTTSLVKGTTGGTALWLTAAEVIIYDSNNVAVANQDLYRTGNPDGTVTVHDLSDGWWYEIVSVDGDGEPEAFNAVELEAIEYDPNLQDPSQDGSTTSIKLGQFSFGEDSDISAVNFQLPVEGFDADGDTVASTVDYTIYPDTKSQVGTDSGETLTGAEGEDYLFGMGGDDELVGAGGNDVLQGGAGSDILTGGDGDDLFLFTMDDQGTGVSPDMDTITDFNDSGVDVIDLRDLLDGEESGDLTDYLDVVEDTINGNVVINVTPSGAGGDVTEVITLEGKTLADLGAVNTDPMADIISDLVANGHIDVDQ